MGRAARPLPAGAGRGRPRRRRPGPARAGRTGAAARRSDDRPGVLVARGPDARPTSPSSTAPWSTASCWRRQPDLARGDPGPGAGHPRRRRRGPGRARRAGGHHRRRRRRTRDWSCSTRRPTCSPSTASSRPRWPGPPPPTSPRPPVLRPPATAPSSRSPRTSARSPTRAPRVRGGADGVGPGAHRVPVPRSRPRARRRRAGARVPRGRRRRWAAAAVTVRTLDVGGDKPLPYLPMPAEENPFLGLRGIRLVARPPRPAGRAAARALPTAARPPRPA